MNDSHCGVHNYVVVIVVTKELCYYAT